MIGKSRPRRAHQVDQGCGLALHALLAPVDHHAADRRVGLHRYGGVFETARLDDLEAGSLDFLDDLVEADAFEIVGVEGGRRKQKRKASEIVHGSPRYCPTRAVAAFDDISVTIEQRSSCPRTSQGRLITHRDRHVAGMDHSTGNGQVGDRAAS